MPEQSENETSTDEQPENEAPEASAAPVPYSESENHVPDPTAMTGTLETSGTGGGVHASLPGVTRIFGDVEHITVQVESLISERIESLTAEVRSLLLQQAASAQAENIPQQTVEDNGLPSNQGNIIAPQDSSGAAKDADRSGNVNGGTGAGSPADVSTENERPETKSQEKSEGDKTDAEHYVDTVKESITGSKTPAKKTAAPTRRSSNNKQK